jgi:hypothetical protein
MLQGKKVNYDLAQKVCLLSPVKDVLHQLLYSPKYYCGHVGSLKQQRQCLLNPGYSVG